MAYGNNYTTGSQAIQGVSYNDNIKVMPPAPASPIIGSLSIRDSELSALHEAIGELERRLADVMRPTGAEAAGTGRDNAVMPGWRSDVSSQDQPLIAPVVTFEEVQRARAVVAAREGQQPQTEDAQHMKAFEEELTLLTKGTVLERLTALEDAVAKIRAFLVL